MPKTTTLNMPVPGDPSGTALGIVLPRADADGIIRPGMLTVRETMPTLATKGAEILAEIDDPRNQLKNYTHVLIRINRVVDEKLLLKGKLRVVGCDEGKILALIAALGYEGSARAHELSKMITAAIVNGGVPFRVKGEAKLGGSIHLMIFDQSLELKFVTPS
jgi:hypothetical protein